MRGPRRDRDVIVWPDEAFAFFRQGQTGLHLPPESEHEGWPYYTCAGDHLDMLMRCVTSQDARVYLEAQEAVAKIKEEDRLYGMHNYIMPEIWLTREDVFNVAHQGQCIDDVRHACTLPHIKAQRATTDMEQVRKELHEYGAWEDEELQDDDANWERIIFNTAWDIKEELEERERYPERFEGRPPRFVSTPYSPAETAEQELYAALGIPPDLLKPGVYVFPRYDGVTHIARPDDAKP